jgi:hypothetical protein
MAFDAALLIFSGSADHQWTTWLSSKTVVT